MVLVHGGVAPDGSMFLVEPPKRGQEGFGVFLIGAPAYPNFIFVGVLAAFSASWGSWASNARYSERF